MLKLMLRAAVVLTALARCGSGAETATARAITPAEVTRLARGAELREILAATLERSYADAGRWPDEPDAVEAASVVLRERFEDHPEGVWIGFGDGHLEFAPTPDSLSECLAQVE